MSAVGHQDSAFLWWDLSRCTSLALMCWSQNGLLRTSIPLALAVVILVRVIIIAEPTLAVANESSLLINAKEGIYSPMDFISLVTVS